MPSSSSDGQPKKFRSQRCSQNYLNAVTAYRKSCAENGGRRAFGAFVIHRTRWQFSFTLPTVARVFDSAQEYLCPKISRIYFLPGPNGGS